MLVAVKGVMRGNAVIEDDGAEVVTGLDYPQKKILKTPVVWDSFVVPSERGGNVDEYMREMRENDRLYKI